MASPLLPNFPFGVLLAFSQRRHCEETQVRIQLLKQLSEKVGRKSQGAAQKILERLLSKLRPKPARCARSFRGKGQERGAGAPSSTPGEGQGAPRSWSPGPGGSSDRGGISNGQGLGGGPDSLPQMD